MHKLTLEPWHAYPHDNGTWTIVRVRKPPWTALKIDTSVENANMLSASRETLYALEMMGEAQSFDDSKEIYRTLALPAIAKARGMAL